MKTIINGFCEIKDGEFVKFGRKLSEWEGTSNISIGNIVRCKVTIEYNNPKDLSTNGNSL